MYTKRIFSPATLILWTRYDLMLFVGIASVPVLLFSVFDQRWIQFPWLPIALVGTSVAFILSFQNNAAYGRVWEARKIWGGIVNSSRALGFMVNDFVTNAFADEPVSEEELRSIRRRMVMRHIAWLTALRHAMRGERPWETNHRARTNREWKGRIRVHELHNSLQDDIAGYVPEGEGPKVCGKANPAAQLLALQSRELESLRSRGLIEDFRHMEMQGVLNDLVGHQGKSERIKNFPYPRQYATLNSTFLWIFIVLIPFGLVHEFANLDGKLAGDYPWLDGWFIWMSVPFSVVVMWIFHTMERIGRTTENPFEGSVNDVPITTISRGIEIDLRQMIDDDPDSIPPPIGLRNHTQT
tara:strand:+ start:1718 stop:2779 length:1062 start_codon:yes stop_codon:yes gene_type:complete